MKERFIQFIKNQQLFEPDTEILLTVSGGIDSVFMLHLFYECNFDFSIAHCNFKLRGDESDKDEQFVKQLAERYACAFYIKSFDTETYAEENNLSIQMAARELRYDWFEEIREKNNYDYIAIAHNLDDLIETFFINLIRGTGLKGLTGIKSKTNKIIRPILFAQRNEIIEYCSKKNISYREDSSNISTKYLRNKIRHEVIPLFKEINPSITETIIQNTIRFAHAEKIYSDTINQIKKIFVFKDADDYYINIQKLLEKGELKKTILFEILTEFNFSNKIIDDIVLSLDGTSGKKFFSSTHRLLRDREFLIVSPIKDKKENLYYIDEGSKEIKHPIHLKFSVVDNNDSFEITKDKLIAYIDYDKVEFPLLLRKWHKGDYFQPFGLPHFKKLSDFFVDNKFSINEKENTWILASGEKIIWVIGYRIDDRFKIISNTKKILIINFHTK